MLNSEMNLINQAFFYEQVQQAQKERLERQRRQNRGRKNRNRRYLNVRGYVGSMLVAVGRRMQTLDGVYAEPSA